MTNKHLKLHQIIITAVSALLCFSILLPLTAAAATKSTAKFIHVEGNKIVDENGNDFLIKGIAFGGDVWDNPSVPCKTHHTEESYKEIAELGFNSVRFYINYGLFLICTILKAVISHRATEWSFGQTKIIKNY